MTKRVRNMSTEFSAWLQATVGADMIPGIGDVFFLAPASSSTAQFLTWLQNNGVDESHYSTSLATLYNRMKTGRNDTMVVLPGNHTLSAALVLSKSYTHIFGAGAPVQTGQRARISNTAASCTPMVTLSGSGCIIKNVMLSQEGSHATTAAVNTYITGARNRFDYVTLRNIGALAVVDNSMRNLVINTSDGENMFTHCTIGMDTFDAVTATNYVLEFTASGSSPHNVFEDTIFLHGGSANAAFLLANTNSTTGWTLFRRCEFINNVLGSMDAMTQAFNIGSGNGYFLLHDCLVHGAAAYETSDSGLLFGDNAYAAATTGVSVQLTY